MSSSDRPPISRVGEESTGLPPLLVIVGPTAVGKSALAIQVAERMDGEIISADSRLFYRGMDIGTAKPTIDDRLRIPHHLIDVANPDEPWSLALFQREARQAIAESLANHHLPVLVGGTGQFVRSVTEGWSIPAVEPDPKLRTALEHWSNSIGPEQMHARLAVLDPSAAEAIDYQNVRRTIRALEVILTTGKRFSEQRKRGYKLYHLLMIGLNRPRDELYRRIDDRIDGMLASGLVDEVRGLLARGYSPDLPTMSAIGYGEAISYIQGDITLDEAIAIMRRRTREFVRRQANWFKVNDPEIHWYEPGESTVDEIAELILGWLETEKIKL